ncbi:DUF4376 domain-containing protein [Azospirillum halopraeferens]|uniref:DUF4376 domain-containing protein n=1 Tax=Azospirillum halopraeferens TaxID=34010 RepID=UPI0003FF0A85|nr:DUF4376 domain-containing protein [Azospirillum halopraeferens]
MWARIDDTGRCAEVTDADPAGRFHPSLRWEPVPDALRDWVDHRYVAVEGGGVAPPSPAYIRTQALERLTERRWRAETGGLTMPDGARLLTRDRDKMLLNGARDKALEEIDETVAASLANGGTAEDGRATGLALVHTVDLGGRPLTATNAQFIAMARAIGTHVQSCFDRWGEIWHAIDAAETWQDTVAVYATEIDRGWPGSDAPSPEEGGA